MAYLEISEFKDVPSIVYKFVDNRVIVKGCANCKECCGQGAGNQVLTTLDDNYKPFYLNKHGEPSIIGDKGCRALSNKGCKLLSKNKMPVTCAIYPFFLIGRSVQAHLACPAVLNTPVTKLQKIAIDVAMYLINLPRDILFRMSEHQNQYLIDLGVILHV